MHNSTITLEIGGMTCPGCEGRIGRQVSGLAGVQDVQVSFAESTAHITFDPEAVSPQRIVEAIHEIGYTAREQSIGTPRLSSGRSRLAGALVLVVALFLLLRHTGLDSLFRIFPEAEAGMGYGMLFVIGLLTSLHCVAMCGGIGLSQCISHKGGQGGGALRPSLLYNLGRVLSYTLIGGVVGAVGSVIILGGAARGLVQVVAGVFMVGMALSLLGLFPSLRRFLPRLPRSLERRLAGRRDSSSSPFYVGLLNGLMPCGPLQAMQLYALSTGSPLKGALSMLAFSLGTAPLLLGLGALSTLLSRRFTHRAMQVGAALVMVMGVSMLSSGLSLSGFSAGVAATGAESAAKVADGVQYVTTTLSSGRYEPIVVQPGIPVVWTIQADPGTINGCNNRMLIPEYGIEHRFSEGENMIAFMPEQSGVFSYSCWMGMIRSSITVTDEDGGIPEAGEYALPDTYGRRSYGGGVPSGSACNGICC